LTIRGKFDPVVWLVIEKEESKRLGASDVEIRVASIVIATPTYARLFITDGASFALKSFERVIEGNARQRHRMRIHERHFRNE